MNTVAAGTKMPETDWATIGIVVKKEWIHCCSIFGPLIFVTVEKLFLILLDPEHIFSLVLVYTVFSIQILHGYQTLKIPPQQETNTKGKYEGSCDPHQNFAGKPSIIFLKMYIALSVYPR